MSFTYPRLIRIDRPHAEGVYGAVGYRGQTETDEGCIARDLPASVQLRRSSGKPDAHLPGDAKLSNWRILLPLGVIDASKVHTRDIVTDDAGERYQIDAAYMTSLGLQIAAERLET